jgi:hypothetical protein
MRRAGRWLAALIAAMVVAVVLMVLPVAYVETACRSGETAEPYRAILSADHARAESRTLMTWPEWHIVRAYEDYAEIIRTGDPHQFGFASSIAGFWSSLCTLSRASGSLGGFDVETKQMVYVIGVSFTAELALKALYEETAGRAFAWWRGPQRAALDELSARHARDYAAFLNQTPWYKWRFTEDAAELRASPADTLRDRERRFALGIEYGGKAAYAGLIEQAVAGVGADELTLRMVVSGADPAKLSGYDGVTIVGAVPQGIIIETPRYRALTELLQRMATDNVDVVEIARNDDIMFTVLSDDDVLPGAVHSMLRQGFGDHRHLVMVKVAQLADRLRGLPQSGARLEHIHDY